MLNVFHQLQERISGNSSATWIAKHKQHHHVALATLALVLAGASVYMYRENIVQAATFTWTQSSWGGGASATSATHTSNQSGWTYSSSTPATTALNGSNQITLPSYTYSFIDDLATSTTGSPTPLTYGGGFGNGTHSSTMATSSGGSIRIATSSVSTFVSVGSNPHAIAFDTSGNLYAARTLASSIVQKVTSAGVNSTFATGVGSYSRALAFDVSGNLYVSSGGALIKVTSDGATSTFATVTGTSHSLAFDGSGNLYSASISGSAVDKTTTGGSVSTFATLTGGGGPRSLAFDTSGNLYTANYDTNNISKITSGGSVSTFASVAGGPTSLAFDTSGNLYVSRYDGGAISKITPAGSASTFVSGLTGPHALAFDSFGNLYATNYDGATVSKINSAGTIVETFTVGTFPKSLAFDASGNLYVGSYNAAGTITKIAQPSSGTFTSAVINLGAKASFTTLGWNETLNSQTITMKARSSANANMSGATDWGSCSNITKNANLSTGGCVTDGHQYIQYQATLSTTNTAVSPTLDSVTVGYTQYALSGDLTSSKYDIGSNGVVSKISWSASTTTDETVKFQVRSSADGDTWTGWCGYADTGTTCAGTNYFTDAHNNLTITDASHPLRSGTGADADRFFQYKAFLTSGGASAPVVTQVVVQYVVNAPPEVQNVTAVQNADGTVTVGYEVRDIDSAAEGSATPNAVIITLQYCTTGSCVVGSDTGWVNASTVTGNVGAGVSVLTGTGEGTLWSSKTLTWTPATDYSAQYNAAQRIRIKVNDSEAANNLGYAVPAANFVMDTKVPAVTYVRVDSSTTNNPVTWSTTDDTTLSYRLSNSAFASLVSNEVAWTATTTGASGVDWATLTGTPSTETVYYQFRDAYGNGVSGTAVAPAALSNFITTDTTNLNANVYREFLSWGIAPSSGFGSYKVYYNTTGAGASYSLLATVSDNAQNYYTHTITTATSSTHFYKVATVNTNGDISEFTSVKSDVPDGSGSTDVTAPFVPVAGIASSVGNISTNITFSTYTDVSLAQGELATSTVRYASYVGQAPTTCPSANSVSTGTFTVNHSVYLTGLTPSTNYVFCVIARDIAGNVSTASSVSEVGGVFTTSGGPVITGVTQREVSDVSATIFWNTDTSSDSKVYYATTASGVNGATPVTGSLVTTSGTNANGTFYQHQIGLTGLTAGQTYYFKVSSTDTAGSPLTTTDNNNGQYYSFVTLKDTTPPTVSATSTPVLASNSAVIVWQTDELATSQVFYDTVSRGGNTAQYVYRTAQQSTMSIFHIATLSSATEKYDNIGNSLIVGGNALTPETIYYATVRSVDSAGNSSSSSEWSFTTPSSGTVEIIQLGSAKQEGPDTDPPAISNIKVSDITPFGATISFETSEDTDGFAKYGKDSSYGGVFGDDTWANKHTIKLNGLTVGAEYHFKIVAHDKSGNTGTSPNQTFKTAFLSENLKDLAQIENIEAFQKEIENTIESILPSLVPPFVSKPQVVEITDSSAKITFKTNIKSFPIVMYAEQGRYDDTKDNPYIGEVSNTENKGTEHTLNLTGLKPNTKYHYQARAFSLPKVIGRSEDLTFITKAAKIAGSVVEKKKDSFTVVWTTTEPTTSIVEYKNLKTGVTDRKTDSAMKTSHSMKIENLPSGTTYAVDISGLTEAGNTVEAGSPISVTTSTDVTAPVISGFKVDNALVPGRTDRIQTIVSWDTDEPANSAIYYEEGTGPAGDADAGAEAELTNKSEILDSYITKHSVILPSLKPGTIYRIKVTSSDDSGNLGSFGPRTVITPRQTESITDIIFKNFEDSFKFLRQI